jgi:hypothetical protein
MGPRYKTVVGKAEKIRPLRYLDVDGRANIKLDLT